MVTTWSKCLLSLACLVLLSSCSSTKPAIPKSDNIVGLAQRLEAAGTDDEQYAAILEIVRTNRAGQAHYRVSCDDGQGNAIPVSEAGSHKDPLNETIYVTVELWKEVGTSTKARSRLYSVRNLQALLLG